MCEPNECPLITENEKKNEGTSYYFSRRARPKKSLGRYERFRLGRIYEKLSFEFFHPHTNFDFSVVWEVFSKISNSKLRNIISHVFLAVENEFANENAIKNFLVIFAKFGFKTKLRVAISFLAIIYLPKAIHKI